MRSCLARLRHMSVGTASDSAMSLAATPPHTICLWEQRQRQEQPLDFTWHMGHVVPFASAASAAGGCLPTFDVDVSGVSCALGVGRRTRASVHGGNKHSWQTMTPRWPGQGATRASRPRSNGCLDLWRYRQEQKFRWMLTAQRRAMYHLTVTGVYSGTLVIFTGCVEADRVTLFHFRNPTARGTLRGLTSHALL